MDEADFRELLDEVESEGGLVGRRRQLSAPALALHQRILRNFAGTGAAPTPEALRVWAAELSVDLNDVLTELVGIDLVQGDPGALRVLGAYPFASESRGHRVDIAGGAVVEAYCAADALGVSAMLDRMVTIIAHDPQTGAEIRVEVRGGEARSAPPEAVVSIPLTTADGDEQAGDSQCPAVNFYTSAGNARAYERVHGLSLNLLTLAQAHRLGSAVFRGHIESAGDDQDRALGVADV